MRWPLSGQLVHQQIWISFQSISVREQVSLVVCCLGKLLSGFWCGIANTYYIVTLLIIKLRMNWQTPFRHEQTIHFWLVKYLYEFLLCICICLLLVKSFRSGRFIISSPMSNAEPNLSCSCWAGLALVHSTAFLIPTARLWTLSNSLAASVTLILLLIDEQFWFGKHKHFYVPPGFDILSQLHVLVEGEKTNILSFLARHWSSGYS